MDMVNDMAVHLVLDAPALERAVANCATQPVVALDTEFMRVRTFYARPALFQLCDGRHCYLIDPLAIEDLAPLAALLGNASVLKIMHSCSEDLEVCERRLGVLPEPLLDTQVMAAFCGHGLSVGYQRILAEEFTLVVEKSETRTDWLQRPLSEAQLRYAAEDVAHLPALYQRLAERLHTRPGRLEWVHEDCAELLARFRARGASADYRAIAGAWRLDARRLAVLRALYAWRERTAREKDLPRGWVVPDAVLLRLADQCPVREEQLGAIADLAPASRRKFGRAVLAELGNALELPEEDWPETIAEPPGPAESRQAKKLRALAVTRGDALGIAPELLARRRDLEELVRCARLQCEPDTLALLQGWRRAAIGEELWREANAGP